ncbi:hypothetical protein Kpol_2000p51 [Vanderwaltozyma polyspora DSM 70294]|uniref:Essential protein Yae1 N-terminal domain-containing protein n=1 Tax=Vanderwaltozyma polyspora (strain ATCC 22028 / DSM 70294 / BCRC 21397 / CBS 2163 / NBRC 10782 / NRRL Y-8283 / UCD 57-17) TaxID=436907 RepID=A7TF59_VANPO|nr:uncharacterized protein Kpol_2000p51 [Vanderwaltozyma polyspora DSM 70294]EDO19084.1 hypothetical protein Kpol_2000p51 [Vanderwaltozyma polyspora DSM 70294]
MAATADMDELLNLEEQFYQEGYQEGQNENLKHNFIEGKQYGLQTGFQRFLLVGQIKGICKVLERSCQENNSLLKNINQVQELISTIKLDNSPKNVEQYESTMVKVKNKFRIILLSSQRQFKNSSQNALIFEKVENICKLLGGEIRGFVADSSGSSEVTTSDQMQDW